jgi:hypothetical protein
MLLVCTCAYACLVLLVLAAVAVAVVMVVLVLVLVLVVLVLVLVVSVLVGIGASAGVQECISAGAGLWVGGRNSSAIIVVYHFSRTGGSYRYGMRARALGTTETTSASPCPSRKRETST